MCSSRYTIATIALLAVGAIAVSGATPRFFPDDPIAVDADRALDASAAKPIEGSNGYDFAEHTFFKPGDRRDVRAANVNTMDEVPDSSWFTARLSRGNLTVADIVRGPNQQDRLDISGWPIVQEKSSGITPGYRVADPNGRLYQIKFDPPEQPEMATAAELIGAAFYHAFGYNVVQGYLVEVDPAAIVISPKATTVDLTGRQRPLRRDDIDRLLKRAARGANGKYRAIASRFADGRPLGYFKYYGTRPDDPNDIHPHEHRRELRAGRVFGAWLNHDDSRGINSLDMLEARDGRSAIRHYMFDFGSTLGSGSTVAQVPRAGNEYILEWGPALKTLFSLGLYVRPWVTVDYPDVPAAVGRFEAGYFQAAAWRPEYPNPAFDNMRGDDAFWAARMVAKIPDEAIRQVVDKARYTDPAAALHVYETLLARRQKVLREWLTAVNPIVDAALGADGRFTFGNAAVAADVATAPAAYTLSWARFDNATGQDVGTPVSMRITGTDAVAPAEILQGSAMVAVVIRAEHPDFSQWALPVHLHFRRTAAGWQAVGLERYTSGPVGYR